MKTSTKTVPLTIAGKIVGVTHEIVWIDVVSINPENPRVRFQIKQGYAKPLGDQALLDLIRNQPGYDPLHKSIRKAGEIHDPVLITHDGTVVEGNSRTTVYKTLHAANKDDARWQNIPVTRLPPDVPAATLARLMASITLPAKQCGVPSPKPTTFTNFVTCMD